ncbi:hypothetical protein HDG68_001160 [Isoptericola chiayiensis]|nr:hypothetical protein [Isoptericola chiayiensis]
MRLAPTVTRYPFTAADAALDDLGARRVAGSLVLTS